MSEQHGYWIHARRKAENSISGYFYERSCTCSVCGKLSNIEKDRCAYCGAVMDQNPPKDFEEPIIGEEEDSNVDIEEVKDKVEKLDDLSESDVEFLKSILSSYQDAK